MIALFNLYLVYIFQLKLYFKIKLIIDNNWLKLRNYLLIIIKQIQYKSILSNSKFCRIVLNNLLDVQCKIEKFNISYFWFDKYNMFAIIEARNFNFNRTVTTVTFRRTYRSASTNSNYDKSFFFRSFRGILIQWGCLTSFCTWLDRITGVITKVVNLIKWFCFGRSWLKGIIVWGVRPELR